MKVCIIIRNFYDAGIRLLPWRYIYEISYELKLKGVDVEIISDGYPSLPREDKINDVKVFRLKRLRLNGLNLLGYGGLKKLLDEKSPDIILSPIGPTSFYFLRKLRKINKPIIGLWMGTRYSLRQIVNVGFGEITRNFRFIHQHIINALVPSFFIKNMVKLSNLKKIIVLNKNNLDLMLRYGAVHNKISIIPPGIANYDLDPPDSHDVEKLRKELELNENNFVILYMGSPLSTRGIDILINAISLIHNDISSFRFIILSRIHTDIFNKQEFYIKKLIIKKNIDNKTKILSGFLDKDDIKNFITLSDVVAFPFKLVPSDNPIAILEVMAQGKTVISTKVDGIPELLQDGKGCLVNPNDENNLASVISTLYSNTKLRKNIERKVKRFMLKYPRWDQTTLEIIKLINDAL